MEVLWRKIGLAGFVFGTYRLLHWGYNLQISNYALDHYSFWESALILFVFSVVFCFVSVKVYDKRKTDWIFVEALKRAEEKKVVQDEQSSITKTINKWSKFGKYPLLLVLLIIDPVIVALYYRRGHYLYNGISSLRVWVLFLVSIILCSILALVILSGIFSGWEFVKDFIFDIIKSCIAIAM